MKLFFGGECTLNLKEVDFVAEYLNLLASKHRYTTIRRYYYDLELFFKWLDQYKGDTTLDTLHTLTEVDYAAFFTYLSDQKYADDTQRRLTTVLYRFLLHLNIRGFNLPKMSPVASKRPLIDKDFISDKELHILLNSMKHSTDLSGASYKMREYLIDRNVSIVILMRYYGLTPSEINHITMNDVNLAQQSISVSSRKKNVVLDADHIQYLRNYLNKIPKSHRPRLRTTDPLFVAFNNRSLSFQFDYAKGMPKSFSIRSIQEMIKDEVRRASLRKLSAQNLRNTCILDRLKAGHSNENIVSFFGFANAVALQRYINYLNQFQYQH